MATKTQSSYAPTTTSTTSESPYQNAFNNWCHQNGISPQYQIMTDRRGGRTAWSCAIVVRGERVAARFWYDGQFVNGAREDAAQMALMRYNVIPRQVSNGS